MMKLNSKQIEAVLALPGVGRFEHFVKVIVDWEEAWGLYDHGWALAADDDGKTVFPLWPAREYAQLCAVDNWQQYQPKAISLEELMEVLLPKLRQDGVLPGIFPTPGKKGTTPTVDELMLALLSALDNY